MKKCREWAALLIAYIFCGAIFLLLPIKTEASFLAETNTLLKDMGAIYKQTLQLHVRSFAEPLSAAGRMFAGGAKTSLEASGDLLASVSDFFRREEKIGQSGSSQVVPESISNIIFFPKATSTISVTKASRESLQETMSPPRVQNIIETVRIVESSVAATALATRLDEVYVDLSRKIAAINNQPIQPREDIAALWKAIGLMTRSGGYLNSVTINSPTISSPIFSGNLTGGNSSFSSLSVTGSATSSFGGGISAGGGLSFSGSLANSSSATSTFIGGIETAGLYVTSLSASSTFANGVDLSAGCFSINGTCVGGSGGGGSGTVNSGTTNRLSYYSGATAVSSSGFLTVDETNFLFGIGSTTPSAKLSINADSTGVGLYLAGYADSTADLFRISTSTASATSTAFIIDSNGKVGIGTTSPYTEFVVHGHAAAFTFIATSTTATSTFAGGLNVGQDNFVYDFSTGVTSISSLNTNNLSFDTDAGVVSWAELPLSSASAGSIEGYTAFLNGSSTIAVYGVSAGSGWLRDDYPRVAIGSTTAPSSKLTVFANGTGTGGTFELVSSASTTLFKVLDNGNVGIGTTSPWRTLSVTGSAGFEGLTASTGAGSLCLSATNEVVYNSASDACLSSLRDTKNDISDLSVNALYSINNLKPVSFIYKQGGGRTRYGFIAEDTAFVDDHLATHDAEGNLSGIDDRALVALSIKGIQDIASLLDVTTTATSLTPRATRLDVIEDRLATLDSKNSDERSGVISTITNWVGQKISAVFGFFKYLTVGDKETPTAITVFDKDGKPGCMMVEDVNTGAFVIIPGKCDLVLKAGEVQSRKEDDVAPADTESPVLTVIGNNPAEIEIGARYVDLGASVTDNTDKNLGIKARINEGSPIEISEINIDTKSPAEYTITYEAKDIAGNKVTAVRKVIVGVPDLEIDDATEVEAAEEVVEATQSGEDAEEEEILSLEIDDATEVEAAEEVVEATQSGEDAEEEEILSEEPQI